MTAPSRWGMPPVPVQTGAPVLAKGGHHVAELGMDAGAVIALVVILRQHFPVGVDEVLDGVADAHRGKRVARGALYSGSKLLGEGAGVLRREVDEDKAAPGVDPDRIEGKFLLAEGWLDVRCGDQRAVQVVDPGVIRTADHSA